ncbi:Arginyl-tRNA--protein transferase 1 [Yarrowia sp. C11]|nr:Arginyl-tRNA--protein transferase 1 [Yarrowia sp. E02]KAG5372194.1 Arginyl-tRNA--protein transferase 1 [Yarrowia sp. C11]
MNIVSNALFSTRNTCGYCKDREGAQPQGTMFSFNSVQMSAAQYQALIDRGFRRSGTYIYKPDLANSCCSQYTIRLNVDDFKASKSQRGVLNRWTNHVTDKAKEGKNSGKNNQFDLVGKIQEGESETFKTRLEPNRFTKEKYQLYAKYQEHVHNDGPDDISESGFRRFLCSDSFTDSTRDVCEGLDVPDRLSGGYHQLYYHNGKLVAMAVLDILPLCVSSVYFLWDPDYARWGLGKVAAMREIALAKALSLPYYYMGYYIPDCVKMKYKGEYHPSYLLDPESLTISEEEIQHFPFPEGINVESRALAGVGVWVPLEEMSKKIREMDDSACYYSYIRRSAKTVDRPKNVAARVAYEDLGGAGYLKLKEMLKLLPKLSGSKTLVAPQDVLPGIHRSEQKIEYLKPDDDSDSEGEEDDEDDDDDDMEDEKEKAVGVLMSLQTLLENVHWNVVNEIAVGILAVRATVGSGLADKTAILLR